MRGAEENLTLSAPFSLTLLQSYSLSHSPAPILLPIPAWTVFAKTVSTPCGSN